MLINYRSSEPAMKRWNHKGTWDRGGCSTKKTLKHQQKLALFG
jgi:hypothetical protein